MLRFTGMGNVLQSNTRNPPQLVPTAGLPAFFISSGIIYQAVAPLSLAFGHGKQQYRLYSYPGPAEDETMAVFCEWHTRDFFAVDSDPHFAIGMRGPVADHPHRGRGLAIGILANQMHNPDDPDHPVQLFKGCPDPPGGPAFFLEDFSINDGSTAVEEWQLSLGKKLPQLRNNHIYRIDVHVSFNSAWVGIWEAKKTHSDRGLITADYTFLGQADWPDEGPGIGAHFKPAKPEDYQDRGQGNAFIGCGFADPETRSWVENIYLAHWKNLA